MINQTGGIRAKRISLGNLTVGNWVSIAAGVLFIASLYLPWFTRGYYYIHFSASTAQDGTLSSAQQVYDPMKPLQGSGYMRLYISEHYLGLYLISLVTVLGCGLLCLPFLFVRRKQTLRLLAAGQTVLSVIGVVPFFFVPKHLQSYRLFLHNQMVQYPQLDPLTSSVQVGVILAMVAAAGLVVGAILTWMQVRRS